MPYGEANVWWPVAEALRQAAGIEGDIDATAVRVRLGEMVANVLDRPGNDAEVLRITEGLLHLIGHEGPLRDLDPGRAREEATWALLTVIEAFAARSPVVVILADLHWADAQVLEFIDELMERLGRLPYVVVGTARHAIHDRWSPRPGRHNSAIVHLEPLDRDAACVLLDSLLGLGARRRAAGAAAGPGGRQPVLPGGAGHPAAGHRRGAPAPQPDADAVTWPACPTTSGA